jgi:hypothetical protein
VATVASTSTQLGWIEQVVAEGVRRPGSAADRRVEDWLVERLLELGLSVTCDEVAHPVWDGGSAELVVTGATSGTTSRYDGFALPFTLPTELVGAELVRWDPARPETARGRVVVREVTLAELPYDVLSPVASRVVDPGGTLAGHVQQLPLPPEMGSVADAAVAAGAVGFVGVLKGMPWRTSSYYVPYDAVDRPLAALWLDAVDGAGLLALLDDEPLTATLRVTATRTDGTSRNVLATLPGPGEEWVVVGSHHDAPWASAVEDGTGIAMVLAQAAYWAAVPEASRPHRMLFVLTAGHLAGAAGTFDLMQRHRDLLDSTVLAIHLEHAAAEVTAGEDGPPVATGRPEPRWWFTSTDPALEESVATAVAGEGLDRSLVLHPETFMEHPPTDGGPLHLADVPLVSFLTAPVYLFDPQDTLDKVHQPSLEPIARAVVRILADTAGRTAAEVRTAVVASGRTVAPVPLSAPTG